MSQAPHDPGAAEDRLRLDKWLWAARFFKTRSLAAQAVDAGHVQVNGERVKPARTLRPGDRVTVRRGEQVMEVVVAVLSPRRGPAVVAQTLFEETAQSVQAREAQARNPAARHPGAHARGRPTKRDRRDLDRFTGEE